MPILQLVLILAAIGFGLWAINKWIPMQPTVSKILNIAVIIGVIVWLLKVFGVFGSVTNFRV